MITLSGIAFREKNRAPMQTATKSAVTCEQGLTIDYRRRPGKRQITVMSRQSWLAACTQLGVDLPWTTRRANLLLDGVTFKTDDVGKVIQIGQLQMRINYETDPCQLMDDYHQGLRKALESEWRGGVCCTVIADGDITLGDKVQIISAD